MSDPGKAVFLSYASQDAEAAKRICDALRSAGVEVWFDAEGGLEHGDEWDAKIRRQIKECVLFLPIISANTQAREEGYFRIEWELAAQRALGIASGVAFILPIVIDDTREPDALVPDRFRTVQWTRLRGGELTPDVKARFLKLWSHRAGVLKHASGESVAGVADPGRSPASTRPATFAKPGWKTYAGLIVAIFALVAVAGWWLLRGAPAAPVPAPGATGVAASAPDQPEFPQDVDLVKAIQLIETIDSTVEDHRLAEDLVNASLARRPNDPEAVIMAAYVSNRFILRGFDVSNERYAAARRLSERALALAPDQAEALHVMGIHLSLRQADPARAVQLLQRALGLKPGRARFYDMYIGVLGGLDPPAGLREAEAAVTRFPTDVILRYRLALVHLQAGRWEDYERSLDETLALSPFSTASIRKAQLLLVFHENPIAAKRELEKVSGKFRLSDRMLFAQFMVAYASGDVADALRALDALPGQFVTDFAVWPKLLLKGDLLSRQGRPEWARRAYEGAQEDIARERARDPGAAVGRAEIWLLIRLGRTEEARAMANLVFTGARRPHRVGGLTHQAFGAISTLLMLGERPKAVELLREAVADEWGRRLLAGTFATNPDLAPWRDDPEIQELLRKPESPPPATTPALIADAPPADDKSVAVLPFANLSGDPGQEYFSDGITEEILGALARERDLRVPGRASAFAFKGKSATNAEIARALNVAQLVEGSVRRAGNQVRISVSLWRTSDARAEPIETVEGEMTGTNIFALQEAVARAVVQRLTLRTTRAPAALPTSNMEAYDLYLRARALRMRSSAPGAYQAMNQLEQVVRLDASFAAAWAELADIAASLSNAAGGYDMSEETRERAVFAATRAVELGPDLAEAHVARATVFLISENDPEAAARELAKAERLQPQGADLARMRAHVEAARNPASASLHATVNRAVALDPENPRALYSLGLMLSRNGQYARADELLRRSAAIGQAQSAFTLGARNWIAWTGELEEGIRRAEACPENYRNEIFYRFLAPWHEQRGDWRAARVAWEKALVLARAEVQRPGIRSATAAILTELGAHAVRAGDGAAAQAFFADARATLEAVSREQPDSQHLRMRWLRWHQAQGDWPAARAALVAAEGLCRSVLQQEAVEQAKAELLAATGASDEAIAILRAAHARGWAFGYTLRHNPELKPLHGQPEFQQLLRDVQARADAHLRPKL